jgi:hypothetical protein
MATERGTQMKEGCCHSADHGAGEFNVTNNLAGCAGKGKLQLRESEAFAFRGSLYANP